MNQERKAFEEWVEEKRGEFMARKYDNPALWKAEASRIAEYEANPYSHPWTRGAWETWKALRAHQAKATCAECGKSDADGWALYCVECGEKAKAEPVWIPVSERLPTERCLAYTPDNTDKSMTYRIIPEGFFRQVARDATHWMPLPKEPKA